ncbi:MAG: HYR domain-containing protein, partial [Thermoanaerobaculia bacterium]
VLLVPDPVVVEATSREGAVAEFEVIPYGGRDPNPTVRCTPESGSLFKRGSTNVECVAENSFGERAFGNVSVFVYDGASPIVEVPDRIVVEADGPDGREVTFEVTAYDSIDGDVAVTCDPPSGSRFPIGVTLVECVAYDSSLNPGYGWFEIEVTEEDDGGGTLVIQVPDDMTVEATGSAGAEVSFTVTAHGSDDPDPDITCAPASGSTFPLGTTNVLCSATDSFGNRAEGEFDITVVDTTAPALQLNDVTSENPQVTYEATATDLVDASVDVVCTPPSGSTFPMGETTVQCTATDDAGNSANGSFVVRVVDSTGPHISSITADPNILLPVNHKLVDVTIAVEATDANDPMPQCSVTTVAANEAVDAPGSGNTEYDWLITGPLTLQLRAERSGEGTDRIYSVYVTCTDSSGNESTASVDVTVPKGGSGDGATVIVSPSGKRRSVRKP